MNITDVAKEAGVSIATVSRVINKSGHVSAKTYEKVMQVINEHGYEPSLLGKSLRERNTKLILVLVTNIVNSYYAKLIKGVEEVAREKGYHVMIANSYDLEEYENAYIPLLTKKMVDGIILASSSFNTSQISKLAQKYPIVQCSENLFENVPLVAIDNQKAAYEIVEMMIKKNRKRIALLTVNNLKPSTIDRFKGYMNALQHYNIPFDKNLVMYSNYGYRNAYKTTEEFLILNPDIDGIFAISDRMAAGAINAIKNAGKRVPDDIAVGSIDNLEISYTVDPKLTTVSQRQDVMGRIAAEMLIKRINREPIENTKVYIDYELKIRDSI